MSWARGKWVSVATVGLLLAAAILPFLRAWDYGLINLDDYRYLTVSLGLNDVSEGIWMPLTWLSYRLDRLIWGEWYGGFHLTSILLHGVNGVLVFVLLRLIFADGRRSPTALACLVGALVWAVHPLRCESVVWLASRKDVLSFFWEVLALIFWVRGSRNAQRSLAFTSLSVLCFIIGSTCKPSVMTFPVLCFLVDGLIVREVRPLRYICPVLYMVFLGAFAAWQQGGNGTIIQMFDDSLGYRILNACAAFGIYVRNTVWPADLAPQCLKRWPAAPRFLIPGIIISGLWSYYLIRCGARLWEDRKEIVRIDWARGIPRRIVLAGSADACLAGCAWFAIALVPMLGIASFGYHAFADRFTYIPAVGLSLTFAWCVSKWRPCAGALLAVLPVLGCATWRQCGFWTDEETLFAHTLRVDGDSNACAHTVLANWYFEYPHDLGKCVAEFSKAVDQDIRHVMPSFNAYVVALVESGETDRIAGEMRKLEEAIRRQFGEERARLIFARDPTLTPEENMAMSVYFSSKIAWWLADAGGVATAEEIFSHLRGSAAEDRVWRYLQWRAKVLKGDREGAALAYDRLKSSPVKNTFLRFRYLEKGSYDGLEWKPSDVSR